MKNLKDKATAFPMTFETNGTQKLRQLLIGP